MEFYFGSRTVLDFFLNSVVIITFATLKTNKKQVYNFFFFKFLFKNLVHCIAAPVPSMYSQQKIQSEGLVVWRINLQCINVVFWGWVHCNISTFYISNSEANPQTLRFGDRLMQFYCIYLFLLLYYYYFKNINIDERKKYIRTEINTVYLS